MTAMIDRVAMAIAGEMDRQGDLDIEGGIDFTLLARAAIEAMREPSDTMLCDAIEAAQEVEHRLANQLNAGYRAMIDAALKEV